MVCQCLQLVGWLTHYSCSFCQQDDKEREPKAETKMFVYPSVRTVFLNDLFQGRNMFSTVKLKRMIVENIYASKLAEIS